MARLKDYRPGLAKKFHSHGCMRCRHRYRDSCDTPKDDRLCHLCRTNGSQRDPWWPEAWMPDVCCLTEARRLDPTFKYDRDVMANLALAGPGPWFRCQGCGRTHPFDPRDIDNYPAIEPEDWK